MKCSRCESITPEGARFCIECGYPVVTESFSEPQPTAPVLKSVIPDFNTEPPVPVSAPEPAPAEPERTVESEAFEPTISFSPVMPDAFTPAAPMPGPEPEPTPSGEAEGHTAQRPELLPPSLRSRHLRTGEILFIEFISWIPVLNIILLCIWSLSRKGNIIRARIAQAKLLFCFISLLAVTAAVAAAAALYHYGILTRSPFPAIIWP